MFGPLLFCKKHYLAHINMSKEKLFVSLSILQKYLRNLLAHVVVVHADIVWAQLLTMYDDTMFELSCWLLYEWAEEYL